MTTQMNFGLHYYAGVFWGPRQESPEELAARWLKLIARLQTLDPIFAHWFTSKPRLLPFDTQIAPLAEKIEAGVTTSDGGKPLPMLGYQLFAHNTVAQKRGPRNLEIHMFAGIFAGRSHNWIAMRTDRGEVPDPDLVTYRIFNEALLALAETFEATIGLAYPSSLTDLWQKRTGPWRPAFKLAWITYVGPRFASLITPPAAAIVDRRPDGGLLMAATDETFVTTNPEHLAVAREIEAAGAPLNALPRP